MILISSILGLFIFFQFMTRISDSYLLLSVQQVFRDTWKALQAEQVGGLTIVFICAILGYGGYRYYGRYRRPSLSVMRSSSSSLSCRSSCRCRIKNSGIYYAGYCARAMPTTMPIYIRYMSYIFALKPFI